MNKTNDYIEKFEKCCMQKGLQESNFMSSSNMDQYIRTVVDAFSDYPVWEEAFNHNVELDTAYSVMKTDLKSRLNKTIGISTDHYESTILIEPPMTKKNGMLQYLTAVDFKSIPLLFHPAVLWLDKYEKFAYQKRQHYIDDKTWYIYIFTTQKKYQMQGYGKKLMEVVSSFAKENEYRIVLETDRLENVAMYEGFGFTLMDASIYNNLNHYVMLWS